MLAVVAALAIAARADLPAGFCEDYAAPAGECASVIDYRVFLSEGTTQEGVEANEDFQDRLSSIRTAQLLNPACAEEGLKLLCRAAFPACYTEGEVVIPANACVDLCEAKNDACSNLPADPTDCEGTDLFPPYPNYPSGDTEFVDGDATYTVACNSGDNYNNPGDDDDDATPTPAPGDDDDDDDVPTQTAAPGDDDDDDDVQTQTAAPGDDDDDDDDATPRPATQSDVPATATPEPTQSPEPTPTFPTGSCVPYNLEGGACQGIAASTVFLAEGDDLAALEDTNEFRQEMLLIEVTRSLGEETCADATLQLYCDLVFPQCETVDGVDLPAMPCRPGCQLRNSICSVGDPFRCGGTDIWFPNPNYPIGSTSYENSDGDTYTVTCNEQPSFGGDDDDDDDDSSGGGDDDDNSDDDDSAAAGVAPSLVFVGMIAAGVFF